ncbi:Putative O-antigen biosynthesis protein precursor [hydrothermal vent metagenome]|uniref:O-antigen biosynthesis protein n=1 Tax=hydrothermal vent metagenome TaxID=652676 RepID=A0A3B1DQT5_9ZZZZ
MYWLILFVIATSIKKEQIQPIITSFLAGMFLSEIIAYGVFFELWAFKDATVGNPSPVMFWIDYSVFMALTSILLLNRILSKNYSLQQKIFFFFFFCTVTGNLFLAIGRTGQVALVFTMFVLIFIHHKATIKSIILGLLVVGSIFTTAYNFSNSFQERSKAGVKDIQKIFKKDFNGSWGIRVVYWITAFDIVKANPLIGVGIGDSQSEIKKTLDAKNYQYINNSTKEFMQKLHPHNQYLLISIQLGIFGLLIFLYMIYCILSLKIQQLEIKILSILFTSIFFISCFAEPLFIKQFTIALFMLFVGLFTVASIEDKSKNVDC